VHIDSTEANALTDKRTQSMAEQGNMEKDPADWVTGDEPMAGAQRSYLKTLCEEAKQPFDGNLSKADAGIACIPQTPNGRTPIHQPCNHRAKTT
jgi:hypothetical protein